MIVLQAPVPGITTTMFMPNPELLNSRALDVKIKNKYVTMSGLRVTYVSRPGTQSLKYTFEVTAIKAQELKKFVELFSLSKWLLTNHLGEIWTVELVDLPKFTNTTRHDHQNVVLQLKGTQNA